MQGCLKLCEKGACALHIVTGVCTEHRDPCAARGQLLGNRGVYRYAQLYVYNGVCRQKTKSKCVYAWSSDTSPAARVKCIAVTVKIKLTAQQAVWPLFCFACALLRGLPGTPV